MAARWRWVTRSGRAAHESWSLCCTNCSAATCNVVLLHSVLGAATPLLSPWSATRPRQLHSGRVPMIVAIEGPSAAGKTTWCRTHSPEGFVEPAPENVDGPDLG